MTACPAPELVCLPHLKRGDTWRLAFVWQQDDGSPVDLTGGTAALQVRDQRNRLVGTPDDISVDLETATVHVTFAAETTALIPAGAHYTDLQMTFADGEVRSSQTCLLPVLEDQSR